MVRGYRFRGTVDWRDEYVGIPESHTSPVNGRVTISDCAAKALAVVLAPLGQELELSSL
jgi:hypothetical protein